jgi:hypothetical protein
MERTAQATCGLVGGRFGVGCFPDGPINALADVQQMLRAELRLRPALAGLERDACEIADLIELTVPDRARQGPRRIRDVHPGTQRHRPFHLQASSRIRYVFQMHHAPLDAAVLVLPFHVYQFGAQQSRFYSPVQHIVVSYRPKLINCVECIASSISAWLAFSGVWRILRRRTLECRKI